MTATNPGLVARSDTFLGVCETLGEDLRVPANLLRIAFGVALALTPVAALVGYVLLAGVIALTRFVWPASVRESVVAAPLSGANDDLAVPLAEAA
ncbi:PspC domain-containing protein [Sphingomonas jatrophae]|uniref:Phage shock protein PspC N-terminal domain-containing protein n=1 Tax=Sphingomonas jatrophae TaxID=1166337 RepID=A0A1I6KYL7_9SPHN|nr:PspC domain-containing protein [Sphingomonas jatrophae]SFR96326.1 hypothetical protein SAMN05192580_1979 [Sphingomonas jatrophae]